MMVGGFRRIGLIALCAVLTPFPLDIVWNLLPLANIEAPGFVYSFLCFIIFVFIVGLLNLACTTLTGTIDAQHALLFTLMAMIAMRINHLIVDHPQAIELNQALAMTFACLLVFSFHLLRNRKPLWGKRKTTKD